jgi:hypothetical protein
MLFKQLKFQELISSTNPRFLLNGQAEEKTTSSTPASRGIFLSSKPSLSDASGLRSQRWTQSTSPATVTFSNNEPIMAEQKAKKKLTIETVREVAQAIFPQAKKR